MIIPLDFEMEPAEMERAREMASTACHGCARGLQVLRDSYGVWDHEDTTECAAAPIYARFLWNDWKDAP